MSQQHVWNLKGNTRTPQYLSSPQLRVLGRYKYMSSSQVDGVSLQNKQPKPRDYSLPTFDIINETVRGVEKPTR